MAQTCLQPYDLPLEKLYQYKPSLTRQPDFDLFWKRTQDQLADIAVEYKMEKYDYPVRGIDMYKVSYPGFQGANIEGWLAMPAQGGPFPGLMIYHGYNWAMDGNIHDVVNWALKGYAAFEMLVRGQQGGSVDNVIPSAGFTAGWMTKGIQSPEEYYYKAVYMDAVRALEVLKSIKGVDADRIGVTGLSQGGALTLAAAALSAIPKVAVADYPYLSHFDRAIDITPSGPYSELNEYFRRNSDPAVEEMAKRTLSYFDVMNLAPDIKCHTLVFIGLIDQVTPPSTVFAAYNHMACSKEIKVFRYFGHEFIPGSVEYKLRTMMKHLQD